MTEINRLDEVSIFNDKVQFLIPHEWVEGDDGDPGTYLYHASATESGWFRISLITADAEISYVQKLQEIFERATNFRIDNETGNYVASWEKETLEEDTPIHIYYWKVANKVADKRIREAIFSYTVLAKYVEDLDNKSIVNLLTTLVCRARFNPE